MALPVGAMRNYRNLSRMALLACGLLLGLTQAHATLRIVGSLSNFDVWDDEPGDCDGFEIEVHGKTAADIWHTYNYSRFGAPTVTTVGTGPSAYALIKYHSDTVLMHQGDMTHFGVSINGAYDPNAIIRRWIKRVVVGSTVTHQVIPNDVPTHAPEMVTTNGGLTALRDTITNNEPDDGRTFWVLPYVSSTTFGVRLEDLMRDNPLVTGSTPVGDGPSGLDPVQIDPQDKWFLDDDQLEPEVTGILWYKVYRDIYNPIDNSHTPGALITVVMDGARVTASGGRTVTGQIQANDLSHSIADKVVVISFFQGANFVALGNAALDASGTYTMDTVIPPGTYTAVAHLGRPWLDRKATVTVSGTTITMPTLALKNGDVNGDGVVNLGDFSKLSQFYGRRNTTAGWATRDDSGVSPSMCDLTDDGRVNLSDFSALSTGYGARNDTP